ncbi:hypothetical protein HZH66_008288 [Vespula vulgaris]|uniref:Uncharacterized protein n=1 Tax=Vespula vulgaris TaxID=7454 RepID=A0A834JY70_VESVU|nr:hypothetical protein HZH66_008288 [Vespula vulgaris]
MAVRHYAREYAIRIKATERNHDDNLDDSDDYGESEDHYPLIRQTTKDLTISTDIYKGINNEIRPSSKFVRRCVEDGPFSVLPLPRPS